MAAPIPSDANEFLESQLDERIKEIEKYFSADALSFSGPILFGVDNLIRIAIEKKKENANTNRDKLIVILTTTGGYIEVVQRIVDTLRQHYNTIDFIIPNYAYSAGTVLVMSGDSIYMDYYARLGPIDPQVENLSGKMVPALGYLEQYSRLITKANEGKITAAEIQLLVNSFDQAELYQYEQARELSIALLKEWLVKYKFKNWIKTKTRGKRVTQRMRTTRAGQIAKDLNKTEKWHVHGHGISMEVLRRDLRLKIDDFGENQKLDDKIRKYYNLLDDYMIKRGNKGVLHTEELYQPFA
jgi:serine dehydrogenase proteinase